MNRKKIVKKFTESGLLLHPDLLQTIDEDEAEKITEDAKESNQVVVTSSNPQSGPQKTLSADVREIKNKKEITPKDLAEFYRDRFNKLKEVLHRKTDAVSVNKLKNTRSAVSVVGMTKEQTEKGFYLEDTTGRVEIINKKRPDPGDVVAVKGVSREDKFFADDIIYPGISLKREIGKIKDAAVLLSPENPPDTEADLIFTLNGKPGKNTITDLPNPAPVKIRKGNENLELLIYRPSQKIGPEEMEERLQKRHLMPSRKEINSDRDHFTLDPVPDICWIVSGPKKKKIYKGTTLIFTDQTPALVDLETKEVKFLEEA